MLIWWQTGENALDNERVDFAVQRTNNAINPLIHNRLRNGGQKTVHPISSFWQKKWKNVRKHPRCALFIIVPQIKKGYNINNAYDYNLFYVNDVFPCAVQRYQGRTARCTVWHRHVRRMDNNLNCKNYRKMDGRYCAMNEAKDTELFGAWNGRTGWFPQWEHTPRYEG